MNEKMWFLIKNSLQKWKLWILLWLRIWINSHRVELDVFISSWYYANRNRALPTDPCLSVLLHCRALAQGQKVFLIRKWATHIFKLQRKKSLYEWNVQWTFLNQLPKIKLRSFCFLVHCDANENISFKVSNLTVASSIVLSPQCVPKARSILTHLVVRPKVMLTPYARPK